MAPSCPEVEMEQVERYSAVFPAAVRRVAYGRNRRRLVIARQRFTFALRRGLRSVGLVMATVGIVGISHSSATSALLAVPEASAQTTCGPDGTACDDGNPCTMNDVCSGGTCVGGDTVTGCLACQAVATLPPQGGTFAGTARGTGTLAGSCGGGAEVPERVYAWTPTVSGITTIQTCGSDTLYDTVMYVRSDSCTGPEIACNDDTAGCFTGEPSSQHGSRVTLNVTAGQTFYIVVDGYVSGGTFSLTITPPSTCGNNVRDGSEECDGTDSAACAYGRCTVFCICEEHAPGLPDFLPVVTDLSFDFRTSVASGDVAEGCASATAGVDLLRFSTTSWNIGSAPIQLGDPMCPDCSTHPLEVCGNPYFICSPAQGHDHPHYANFARYEVLDATGQTVVGGHKESFCLDDGCGHTCFDQGLNPGCSDTYASGLGCQYVDITRVPDGNYSLRVTVDPLHEFVESNEANNIALVPFTIARPVCGNGILESGEQCDDGNLTAGDGCGPNCTYELIPGNWSGTSASNQRACLLEWSVVNPGNSPPTDKHGRPRFVQTCKHGDTTCDFGSAPGACEFHVVACLNNVDPNLPSCPQVGVSPPVVLRPTQGRDPLNFNSLTAALQALRDPKTGAGVAPPVDASQTNVCTAPFCVHVPLRRGTRRGRLTLSTRSQSLSAPLALRDVDRLELICSP